MARSFFFAAATSAILAAGAACGQDRAEAVIRAQAQALMDAVTAGDPGAWKAYLHEQAVYTDEEGGRFDKAQMLAQVRPLPKGVSGRIELTDWRLTDFGDVAVDTYVADEHEDFHGQKLHALYRVTETWLKTAGGWRLIASQTLAMRQDPPAAALPEAALQAYVGRYAAAPDYIYEITREGAALTGRTNGGKPSPLLAELADVLFTPGQPRTRKIFQRDAWGRITGFVSRREERDVVFKRLD
jgi:ketosteroid isomerase-like protein